MNSTPDVWPAADRIGPAQRFPRGAILFEQGAPVETLYFVQDGFVKLTRVETSGRARVTGLRSQGWLLGGPAALLELPHPASGETVVPCILRLLSVPEYLKLIREDVAVAAWVVRLHARETYEQTVLLGEFGSLSPRQRLEHFLARSAAGIGPFTRNRDVRIQLPLKQHEVAQAIGVTPEYLSRLYARLEIEGMLRREKGWIVIPKTSVLARTTSNLSRLYEDR